MKNLLGLFCLAALIQSCRPQTASQKTNADTVKPDTFVFNFDNPYRYSLQYILSGRVSVNPDSVKCLSVEYETLKNGFPDTVYSFRNVEELWLLGITDSTVIDERILNLTKVRHLSVMVHTNGVDFPSVLFRLPALEDLEVDGCRSIVFEFPEGCGLRQLNLNHCGDPNHDGLDSLKGWEHLKKLEIINLVQNYTAGLPGALFNLPNLRVLDVFSPHTSVSYSQNHLWLIVPEIPGDINKLSKLEKLVLEGMGMQKLNLDSSRLVHLKYIDVRGNCLPDNKYAELKKEFPKAKVWEFKNSPNSSICK
jgi:Leucine-rich repeat (LRR) protein